MAANRLGWWQRRWRAWKLANFIVDNPKVTDGFGEYVLSLLEDSERAKDNFQYIMSLKNFDQQRQNYREMRDI